MLSYEDIFSRVLNKIDDPKELQLNDDDLLEIYTQRLHSVISKFVKVALKDESSGLQAYIPNLITPSPLTI